MGEREEFIAGLRDLADWLEERPELPGPVGGERVLVFTQDAETFREYLGHMGAVEKNYSGDDYARAIKRFGPINYEVFTDREKVCRRVQVGTRTVAQEVPVEDVETKTVEVEEPVYEWDCSPFLADREATA